MQRLFAPIIGTLLCLTTFSGLSLGADTNRVTLRINFGMKDQQPTDWSGKLSVGTGKVESIRGWRWVQNDLARWRVVVGSYTTQVATKFGRKGAWPLAFNYPSKITAFL